MASDFAAGREMLVLSAVAHIIERAHFDLGINISLGDI